MTFRVDGELTSDGRIVLLPSGDLVTAGKHLATLTPTVSSLRAHTGVPSAAIPVTWATVVQLTTQLGTHWRPGPALHHWIQTQLAARTSTHALLASVCPGAPEPYEHQIHGARIIAVTGRALIFDEAGTGKTLTAILGLLELWARGCLAPGSPVLVVCPASVVSTWAEAWERWTGIRPTLWQGSARRRLLGSSPVYVTTYGIAARDGLSGHSPLLDLTPGAVVIDECHKMKNRDSQQSRGLRRIAAQPSVRSVIALSGTPITHHAGDLWPTLNALEPRAWPSAERYRARYLDTVQGDYREEVIGLDPAHEVEFRTVLLGQYRRLAKREVLDLPPKTYSRREVTLPAAARKAYDAMEQDMIAELDTGEELSAFGVLAQLQRLLQLSCASADVSTSHGPEVDEDTGEEKEHVHVTLREPSWKVDAFLDVLTEREGQQVLAFAPSAQLIRLAGARASKAGLRVGYVIGSQSPAERAADVARFQAGKLDVICATTGAGGVGLTLTAASTVVFLQRPWSYVEAAQAEDRAHRIGSERHASVEIVDIVAVDTIDERIRSVLAGKAEGLAELLEDPKIVSECLGGQP
jgi:SNF2 family DNA or RNA helicase